MARPHLEEQQDLGSPCPDFTLKINQGYHIIHAVEISLDTLGSLSSWKLISRIRVRMV
jgi:hypothetical protein